MAVAPTPRDSIIDAEPLGIPGDLLGTLQWGSLTVAVASLMLVVVILQCQSTGADIRFMKRFGAVVFLVAFRTLIFYGRPVSAVVTVGVFCAAGLAGSRLVNPSVRQ